MSNLPARFLSRGDKLPLYKAFCQFGDGFSTQLSTAFVDNRKTRIQAIGFVGTSANPL
jgi:hypothetical protein